MTTPPAEALSRAQHGRACLVTLAGDHFAVEVRHAREVVDFDGYTTVPLAPSHLLGVANLRGALIPLVDIRPFLGLEPARATRETRALVVECDGVQAALLIDEVVGLEPLEGLDQAEGGGDSGAQTFIVGRFEREGRAVTLLDVRSILAALAGPAHAAGETR